jgi:hypothetical protein
MFFDHLLLFFYFFDLVFEVLIFLSHSIQFGVQFECFFSKDDHFFLEVLNAVIGGEHLFLFFGLVFDLCKFLLDLGDVAAVGVEKLGLVFLYHVLHLLVHVVDRLVQVPIRLQHWLHAVGSDELPFALHE